MSRCTAKQRAALFAQRIETPLGAMVAVADDEGLRLLEFADRRALERELGILRSRLRMNIVPGDHPHLEAIRVETAQRVRAAMDESERQISPELTPEQQKKLEQLKLEHHRILMHHGFNPPPPDGPPPPP